MKLKHVLVVSLAVNLFFGGMLAAQWLRTHGAGGPPRPEMAMRGFAATLPEEKRAMVEAHIDTMENAMRGRHADMEATRRAIHAAIAADPFDPQALRAAFAGMEQGFATAHKEMTSSLIDLLSGLDAAERARLAAELDKMGPPPP